MICGSLRQFNSVGVLLVALVLFRKNLFEPMRLFLSEPLIYEGRMVIDEELLAATLTPKRSHFPEAHCLFSTLTLLYCHCPHLLNFSD